MLTVLFSWNRISEGTLTLHYIIIWKYPKVSTTYEPWYICIHDMNILIFNPLRQIAKVLKTFIERREEIKLLTPALYCTVIYCNVPVLYCTCTRGRWSRPRTPAWMWSSRRCEGSHNLALPVWQIRCVN